MTRSLLPKPGVSFVFAAFASDADYLFTRFDNGRLCEWNLHTFELRRQVDIDERLAQVLPA